MTTAQITAMQAGKQAGKQAANARKARERASAWSTYLSWVKGESLAYKRLMLAREISGPRSTEAQDAEKLWKAIFLAMPNWS